jgi:GrpB-like predicted nucleotidyltransferase (UPF0157 family)
MTDNYRMKHVGLIVKMNTEKIRIKVGDYDNNWPAAFQKEAKVISAVLPEEIVHIGSTAARTVSAPAVIGAVGIGRQRILTLSRASSGAYRCGIRHHWCR